MSGSFVNAVGLRWAARQLRSTERLARLNRKAMVTQRLPADVVRNMPYCVSNSRKKKVFAGYKRHHKAVIDSRLMRARPIG